MLCKGCKSQSDQNPELSFHRFPKDLQLRKKWVDAIRQPLLVVSDGTRICSAHFQVVGGKIRKNELPLVHPPLHGGEPLDGLEGELGKSMISQRNARAAA